jgi:hypothetical protein
MGYRSVAFEQFVCGLLYRDWVRAVKFAENKNGTQQTDGTWKPPRHGIWLPGENN